MTQLKLEVYCQGCKLINPKAMTHAFYVDDTLHDSTVFIVCEKSELCDHLYRMLNRKQQEEGSETDGEKTNVCQDYN